MKGRFHDCTYYLFRSWQNLHFSLHRNSVSMQAVHTWHISNTSWYSLSPTTLFSHPKYQQILSLNISLTLLLVPVIVLCILKEWNRPYIMDRPYYIHCILTDHGPRCQGFQRLTEMRETSGGVTLKLLRYNIIHFLTLYSPI